MDQNASSLPRVVSTEEWQHQLDELRVKEKAHMRAGDAVSAARRRLPMVEVDATYGFVGPDGPANLLELFDGRLQLVVYHFMFDPAWGEGCTGCSWFVDAMTHPAHLHARDTSLVLVSRAPLDKLEAYRKRMGWQQRWVSSFGSTFNIDMGATVDGEEHHGLSVFVRDGDDVFRSYYTGDRGVEHIGTHWTYLDLTPFGRGEPWEDSPPGWPQDGGYHTWRRHDQY